MFLRSPLEEGYSKASVSGQDIDTNHKKWREHCLAIWVSQWKIPWLVDLCSLPSHRGPGWLQLTSLQFTHLQCISKPILMYYRHTSYVVDTWPLTGIIESPKNKELGIHIRSLSIELRLENVPDLEFLSSYERNKIASSLVEVKFEVCNDGFLPRFFGMESNKGWQFMKGTKGWHNWSLKEKSTLDFSHTSFFWTMIRVITWRERCWM